jgi:hypothetical protein
MMALRALRVPRSSERPMKMLRRARSTTAPAALRAERWPLALPNPSTRCWARARAVAQHPMRVRARRQPALTRPGVTPKSVRTAVARRVAAAVVVLPVAALRVR